MPATLRDILNENVREGAPELYEKLDRSRVRCFSCGHCCPIPEGQPGVCRVRYNKDRKSTRLNSSHEWISYAVFCLKKKKKKVKYYKLRQKNYQITTT